MSSGKQNTCDISLSLFVGVTKFGTKDVLNMKAKTYCATLDVR